MAALRQKGVKVGAALVQLGVARSTYYAWRSAAERRRRGAINALLPAERSEIIKLGQESPHLRHRTISGMLRHRDIWVSPSTCYRVLSAADLIEDWQRREAPWQVPVYEPTRPNVLWGEDWTKLLIAGQRWYLLVVLDLFSRLVVSWEVVPTVTGREVKELVARGVLVQGLDRREWPLCVRADAGAPNVSGTVRAFFEEIGVDLSIGRVHRPTDNARVERFNGTIKQEEVYCQGPEGYLSPEGARLSIGRYMDYYCRVRPHQALWGFTPAQVHAVGNKTQMLDKYREQCERARQKRLRHNRQETAVKLSTFEASFV